MVSVVFTARQLQEKCRKQHKDLLMAFVNLSKAFDTVKRDVFLFISNIKFVNILCQFYGVMTSKVTVGGQESALFPT